MKTTIIVSSEFLGDAPEGLSSKLMANFLRKLCVEKKKPDRIIFYGSGVKLLARGCSNVLDIMEMLHGAGVDLVACGTCVKYFELGDRIHTGRVSNMQELVSILLNSEKTVTVT